MAHKDRARYLAYLTQYRAARRPSPEIQQRESLPPIGAYEYSEDGSKIRCHVCGRWFGALNVHIRTHGLDHASYKEAYGLNRTSSLLSPVAAEKQRQAAITRGQGDIGKDYIPPSAGRPGGVASRLQTRVEASMPRRRKNMRAGEKIK